MTNEWRAVGGSSLAEQASRVAGALAEAGVQSVKSGGIAYQARTTDLPRVLVHMSGELSVETDRGGLAIRLRDERLWWRASDSAWTAALA